VREFLIVARVWTGGTKTTINNNLSPPEKFLAKPKSKRAKRKRGLGKMNFCPLAFRRRRNGVGSVSAIPALIGRQNKKIFLFLN
jgi:hypothetical protein